MRKEIITRIIVWIVTIALIILGGFAVNEFVLNREEKPEEPSVSYALNTESFDGIVAYGETIDLSLIKITKTENGVSTDIPVDASMVTTPVDTTRTGAAMLTLSYEGKEFPVPITVKYKVQFATDDGVFETIYTLSSSELDGVKAPEKEGYTFAGWSTEIPDVLFENMHLVANYEAIIPSLPTIEATYGDLLANIKLPDNAAGAWKLDSAEGTVGNAGRRTFDVSFVENGTNKMLKTAKLIVNVAKRAVKIDVFADFTYNGKRQEPTYTTDIDVKITAWWDGNKNYTDAGEYSYHFEVDDSNYIGEAKGTYTIKPAVVTVEIKDDQIFANEALPQIEYQISGFEGMSQEELAEFVGLAIVYPQSVVVGEHKITAKASNPSIQLEVKEGTLKVIQATLEGIGDPVLISKVATYGDLIGSIEFEGHPNGKWIWETPTAAVGVVGKQTHTAIFVPSNSAYEQIKCEVEITVVPKPMDIEIVGNTTFDYDGTDHKLSLTIKDKAGNLYNDLEVLGNDPCKNAGTYTITLTLADPNYSATKVVTLTINKVDPVTDFTQVFAAVWSATLKLSDIKLPEGYAWANPDKRIETAKTASYAVIFTPSDTVNYNKVEGEFAVEVEKATPEIKNAKDSYAHTYDGNVYTIAGVTASNNGTLVYTYEDGTPFIGVTDAGTYTVIITLLESENYKAVEKRTTVTISPAENEKDSVRVVQGATFGDPITVIELPKSEIGSWYIEGEHTTVGSAGTNYFVAVFKPATGNYKAKHVNITVTVGKRIVGTPSAVNPTSIYDNTTKYSGLEDNEIYTVIVDGAINVGTYEAELQLVDPDNYTWDYVGNISKTTKVKYSITKATITFESKPEIQKDWTFTPGQTIPMPDFDVDQSFVPAEDIYFEYQYSADGGQTWTGWIRWADASVPVTFDLRSATNAPSQAGMYRVRAIVVGTDNYDQITTSNDDIVEFVIHKAEVVVPNYTKQYPYRGVGVSIEADIPASDLYNIKYTAGTYVGNVCYATLTLKDSVNYKWVEKEGEDGKYGHSNSIQLNYEIIQASPELSGLTVPKCVFGNLPTPSVSGNKFGVRVTYTYAMTEDGEYSNEVPTAVGTYWVKATFGGNDNIRAQTIGPVSFEIEKTEAFIGGVTDGATISKDYRGTEGYTFGNLFPNLKGSHNETLLVYQVDGVVVDAATFKFVNVKANDGVYTVVITLPESDDYQSATLTVYVDINKATVSIVTPSINDSDWKYGDDARQPNAATFNQEFAKLYNSEITFKYYSDVNCQNEISAPSNTTDAGTYYVRAEFAGNDNLNEVNSAAKAFTISKIVLTPSIPNKTYNGDYQTSGLNDPRYTVTEVDNGEGVKKGGKDVGTYTVTLTLTAEAFKNYAWNNVDNQNLEIEVSYTIIREETLSFTNAINIEGWVYGKYNETDNAYTPVVANKDFANALIEYQYSADGGNTWSTWSDPADFDAGSYKIRAIIVGTDNYNQVVSEDSFTVAKAPVYITKPDGSALPETDARPFNNTLYDIPEYKATNGVEVNVTVDGPFSEIKNVGKYTITYSFDGTGTNYLSATETITVTIQKATIVVSNITVTPWAYKATTVSTPVATIVQEYAQGKEYFQYSTDGGTTWLNWNDDLDKLQALSAGTYKVRAVVPNDLDNNYNGTISAAFDFVVNKATTTITGPQDKETLPTQTYRESGYQVSDLVKLGAGHGGTANFEYTCKMWNTATEAYDISADRILHAGRYEIVITLRESANYLSTSITVYVSINKETEDDSGIVVDASKVVYGKPVLEAIKLPESEHGTWSIVGVNETTKFDAVGAQTFTAVFEPDADHEADYDTKTVTIDVVVAQAPTSITVNGTYSNKSYDGQPISIFGATVPNVENGEIVITVNGEEVAAGYQFKNAGEYEIKYTYAGNTNYKGTTVTINVEITKADVTIDLTIDDKWTYNTPAGEPSANFNELFAQIYNEDIDIEYYYDADCKNQITATADKTLAEILNTLDVGTYYVKAVFESNQNLKAAYAVKSFEIEKATVPVPEYEDEYRFTGKDIPVVFPNGTSTLYTITGNVAKDGVKDYTMVLDLGTNFKNYDWVDAEGNIVSYNAQRIELGYKVVPATVTLENLNTGWTYGAYNNKQPTVTIKLDGVDITELGITIRIKEFKYYTNEACTDAYKFTPANNTPAGEDYWVVAVVEGTKNFAEATLKARFTVEKATPTINGIENKVYGKVYDGAAYEFPSTIKGSYTGAPAVEYESIVNFGEYTVSITLPESDNYKSVTVTGVQVSITKATNTETITVSNASDIVYGKNILDIIALPDGIINGITEGTWVLKYNDADNGAVVGNSDTFEEIRDFTFWAVYTCTTGNYKNREVEITVKVGKAPVEVPTVGTITFNGQPQNSGIEAMEGYSSANYEVFGEDGPYTAAGSYSVILKLKDVNYYKWTLTGSAYLSDANGNKVENADAEYVTIPYRIYALDDQYINATITPSWQYQLGQDSDYGSAQVGHGGYVIYYKLYTDESVLPEDVVFEYSEAEKTRPTLPGTYVARFVTTDTNYAIEEETLTFTITAREITPPDLTPSHFPYSSNPIKSGLTDGKDGDTVLYTIVGDTGYVNVNASGYTVYLQLANEYYVWDDGNDETIGTDNTNKSFTYYIDALKIVISGLNVPEWVYDPNNANAKAPDYDLNVPEADKNDVEVTFKYYKQDGTYIGDDVIPTTVGWYYVVATATPVDNDNLTTSVATASGLFEITKAPSTITGAINGQTFNQKYRQGGYAALNNGITDIFTLGTDHGEAKIFEIIITKGGIGATINGVGTYSVQITLKETDNYQSKTINVTVKIDPAAVPFDESYKSQTITFGNSIALPSSPYGDWSIKEAIEQAGANQTFTAIFTSTDNNYASNTEGVKITVNINKAPLTFTVSGDISAPYTNGAFALPTVKAWSSITNLDTDLVPTITINGKEPSEIQDWSVGEYTVVYTFDGGNNYVSDSKSITFTVTPAQITFTGAPSIAGGGWTYHPQNTGSQTPSNTVVQTYAQGAVYFEYSFYDVSTQTWGEWTRWDKAAPENAGDYKVRAVVPTDPTDPTNPNYIGAISTEGSFKIDKASTSITVTDEPDEGDYVINETYDGDEVNAPSGTVSNGVVLTPTVEKLNDAGKYVSHTGDIVNAGTYRVTYAYNGDGNYDAAATKIVTITISPAKVEFNEVAIRDENGNKKEEWIYDGNIADLPIVSFVTGEGYYAGLSADEIYFEYQYSADGITWTAEWEPWQEVATLNERSASTGPQNAGHYRVRAKVQHNTTLNPNAANYVNPENVVGECEFEIKKAPITIVPGISEEDGKDYNGVAIEIPAPVVTPVVKVENSTGNVTLNLNIVLNIQKGDDDLGTFTNPGAMELGKDAGTYTLTYTVAESDNYLSQKVTVEVTISALTDLTFKDNISIQGWEYGGYNATINAYTRVEVAGDGRAFANSLIKYQYSYLIDSETNVWSAWEDWTDSTNPARFDANSYKIRAIINGTPNYNEVVSEAEFVIEKGDASISGVTNDATIETPYNKDGYSINDLFDLGKTPADNTANFSFTVNGNTKEADEVAFTTVVPNNGVYTLFIKLSGDNNYEDVEVTVYVKITPAENKDTFNNTSFGATYNDNLWTAIQTNMGITELPYGWSIQDADSKEINKATTTVGNAGTSYFYLVFAHGDNYQERDPITITITVGKATASISAVVNGNPLDNNDPVVNNYLESGYTIAQLFTSLTASHNENGAAFTYAVDGTTLTAEQAAAYKFTNVVKNGNEIGSYTLVISLAESTNYQATSLTVNVKITPAENTDTFNNTSFGATYNDNLWTAIQTNMGITELPYGWSIQDAAGNEINKATTTVGNAGTSYFYLVFAHGDNYQARERITITITVGKATPSIMANGNKLVDGTPDTPIFEAIYNGTTGYSFSEVFKNLSASHGEAVQFWVNQIELTDATAPKYVNADTYKVTIEMGGTANYNGATVTVYVKIVPVDGPELSQTEYDATYGDRLLATIGTLPTGWSIQGADESTFVGNYGSQTFTAVYNGSVNYKPQNPVTITINVKKKTVKIDGVDKEDVFEAPYKKAEYIPAAIEALIKQQATIKVLDVDGTTELGLSLSFTLSETAENVGKYKVTISLNETNYTATAVTVTFEITKAEVTFSDFSVTGWDYHPTNETAKTPTVKAEVNDQEIDRNEIAFEYLYIAEGETTAQWHRTTPKNVGQYQVRAVVDTTNYAGTSGVLGTVEISTAYVNIPNPTLSFTYGDTEWKPGFDANDDYYDIEWSDENNKNAGTYTVTLTLKNPAGKDYIKWNDQSENPNYTGVRTYEYVIKPAPTTVTITSPTNDSTVTYKGSAYEGAATVTGGNFTASFTYYKSTGTDAEGKPIWSDALTSAPKDVGYYKVVATTNLNGNTNYSVDSDEVCFTIEQATPSITKAPSFSDEEFYENRFTPTGDGAEVTFNKQPLTGEWSIEKPTFVAGNYTTYEATVSYTFTVTGEQAANFKAVKGTYTVTYVAAAKMGSNYYGTIEAAIRAANAANGGEIWVLPYDENIDDAIYITETITIEDAGTTLILPYGVNGDGRNTYNDNVVNFDLHGGACSNNKHGYGHALAGESLCHVKVIVAEGVTITNYGIIEVSGQLSGGGANAPYAGHTAGEHARLILDKNAKIENYKIIRAAGFIRERNKNNGSSVTVYSGATLYQPYVLKDYISGQYLVGPKKLMEDGVPMTPFNMFVLMNVSPTVRVNNGGNVVTWAALYTGSTDGINTTKTTFIGSGGVIEFTGGEASYLTAKYDPDTEVTKLDVYGGAKTNSMKLEVNIVISVTVDTKDCLFPLTYLYDITLHNGDYTMSQRFKMMPEAKLKVANDATLNIGTLIVYDQDPSDPDNVFVDGRTQIQSYYCYPKKGPAVFTVDGAVTINTLGGKVQTNTVGASVNITNKLSYTAYEPKTYKDGKYLWVFPSQDIATRYTITKAATFDGVVEVTANATGTWVAKQVTLNYNDEGATPTQTGFIFVHSTNKTYASLPALTRDGYAFQGWFSGDTQVKVGDAFPYDATTPPTLTAKWTEGATITLNYNDKGATPNGQVNLTFNSTDVKKYSNLPDPAERAGYTKDGWYYGDTKVTNGSEFATSGNHTLTYKWNPINYTITFAWVESPGFAFDDTILAEIGNPPTMQYSAEMEVIEWPVVSDKYTFGGWYSDAACTKESLLTIISGANLFALAQGLNGDINNGNITIYGQWVPMQYTIYYDGDRYSEYIMDSENYTEYYLANNTAAFLNFDPADSPNYLGRDHYFVGWEYNGELLPADVTNVNQFIAKYANNEEGTISFVLTARWAPKAKVTFSYGANDPNKFTNPSPIWVLPGTEVTFTDYLNQTMTGKDNDVLTQYYFGGWQVSGNGTLNGTKVTANGDVTVEPIWAAKVLFKVNANLNAYPELFNGIVSDFKYGTSYWFMSGTDITLPDVTVNNNELDKEHYFISWTTSLASTGSTLDLQTNTEITITWGEKYSITVKANAMHTTDVTKSCKWSLNIYLNDSTSAAKSYSANRSSSGTLDTIYVLPTDTVRMEGSVTGHKKITFLGSNCTVKLTGGTTTLSATAETKSGTIFDGKLTGNMTITGGH